MTGPDALAGKSLLMAKACNIHGALTEKAARTARTSRPPGTGQSGLAGLVSSCLLSPQEDLHQFVRDLPMPCLSLDDLDSLDAEVTGDNLWAALAPLQPGKAPGPKGFPQEYWCLV
ncbi:hypothetical protein NDU88_006796 [Pleurodeles waltl]|uniref:Uncharacterized protein n=1 Tax=Pleurodeles waltl TaxID=8319 RepID=A0AAV7VQ53_PLEWA|nr:hypothetical protein NDU88_006796 [Pleurodeles waltl]